MRRQRQGRVSLRPPRRSGGHCPGAHGPPTRIPAGSASPAAIERGETDLLAEVDLQPCVGALQFIDPVLGCGRGRAVLGNLPGQGRAGLDPVVARIVQRSDDAIEVVAEAEPAAPQPDHLRVVQPFPATHLLRDTTNVAQHDPLADRRHGQPDERRKRKVAERLGREIRPLNAHRPRPGYPATPQLLCACDDEGQHGPCQQQGQHHTMREVAIPDRRLNVSDRCVGHDRPLSAARRRSARARSAGKNGLLLITLITLFLIPPTAKIATRHTPPVKRPDAGYQKGNGPEALRRAQRALCRMGRMACKPGSVLRKTQRWPFIWDPPLPAASCSLPGERDRSMSRGRSRRVPPI